ncbi:MAG: 2-hydroxychromene-2-carboxylate isomerase, partial [Candidatus Azotimanducaceae bacterium]
YSAYIEAMYSAMWEHALKMDEEDIIMRALDAAALPTQEIFAGMVEPDIKQGLIQNTEKSVSRGTFGSPTLFVGDEIYFGKDKLRDAVEAAQKLNA